MVLGLDGGVVAGVGVADGEGAAGGVVAGVVLGDRAGGVASDGGGVVGIRRGRVVGPGDGDDHVHGVAVGGGDGESVGDGLTAAQGVGFGVLVVQGVGPGPAFKDGQGAVGTGMVLRLDGGVVALGDRAGGVAGDGGGVVGIRRGRVVGSSTEGSSVPVTVMTTFTVAPSEAATVKVSVTVSPLLRALVSGSSLSRV